MGGQVVQLYALMVQSKVVRVTGIAQYITCAFLSTPLKSTCDYFYWTTVEPLCKDTPEMRTAPLIRTSCMVPATKLPLK